MTDPEIASLTRFGDAPFFIFCDHASNAMPAKFNDLGMPDDLLKTHIAWDIGAGPLTIAIAEKLGATVFCCGFSRLIIDVNRDLTVKDLIPAVSDQIPVPGNQMLHETERAERIKRFYNPYHDQLGAALEGFTSQNKNPFAVSIHSFTKKLMGSADDRPWHVGMLWREDQQNALAMIDCLKRATSWKIGDNEPYDARVFNHSVDRHISSRNLPHVTLEVRQDLINTTQGVVECADILAACLRDVASKHNGERKAS